MDIIKSTAIQITCPSTENELKFDNAAKLITLARKEIINPCLRIEEFPSFIKDTIPIVNNNELKSNI